MSKVRKARTRVPKYISGGVPHCTAPRCDNMALPGRRPRRCYYHLDDVEAWFASLSRAEQGLARGSFHMVLEQHDAGRALYAASVRPSAGKQYAIENGLLWLLEVAVDGAIKDIASGLLKKAATVTWAKFRGPERMPRLTRAAYEAARRTVWGTRRPTGRLTARVRARMEALGRILLTPPDHPPKR